MKRWTLLIGMMTTLSFGAASAEAQLSEINLSQSTGDGVVTVKDFTKTPDEKGLLGRVTIALPDYEELLIFIQSTADHRAGNRFWGEVMTPDDWGVMPEGFGQLALFKLRGSQYLAFLPLANELAMSRLATEEGGALVLYCDTWGAEPVKGDIALYSTGVSTNPYEAVLKAWKLGLEHVREDVRSKLRDEKEYPEQFRYLGWCSWEAYHRNVSAEMLLGIIDDYSASGLPIKYMLIDGGHWSFTKGVGPKEDTFPNGYKKIVDAMDDKPFRWLGLHYQALGFNPGLLPAPENDLGAANAHMMTLSSGNKKRIAPKDSPEAMTAWWEYLTSFGRKDGATFIKIDFLKDPLLVYGARMGNKEVQPNAVRAAARCKIALEQHTEEADIGLMNCNANNYPNPFFAKFSASTRCSEDYRKNNLKSAIMHTYHSYSSIVNLGHIYWGDHDMFHSSDKNAGELMAVCKALSGGPVYLSDKPEDVVPENVMPLCYEDGLLPRPLAPGLLSEDALFFRKEGDPGLLKAFAPLAGKSVAIHVMNLGEKDGSRWATLSSKDYENGGSMIQPYTGQWKIPGEGLVLYDVLDKKGFKFTPDMTVTLKKSLGHKLLQLTPIKNGWAAIGRSDKYLCGATVEVVSSSNDSLKIRLAEAGPFVVYSATGAPKARDVEFSDIGGGLYRADPPIGPGRVITLTR